jgi:hypothetical protein
MFEVWCHSGSADSNPPDESPFERSGALRAGKCERYP